MTRWRPWFAVLSALGAVSCSLLFPFDDLEPGTATTEGGESDSGTADDASDAPADDANDANADAGDDASGADGGADADASVVMVDAQACDACASGYCSDGGCDPLVFVTSEVRSGASMGGLSGADTLCAQTASGVPLPGVYRAWLSVAGSNAKDRFLQKSTRPYLRRDGVAVANDFADLISGTLRAPINRFADGAPAAGSQAVWTGTGVLGTVNLPCGSWNTTSGMGLIGLTSETNYQWTAQGANSPCLATYHVYCFEEQP